MAGPRSDPAGHEAGRSNGCLGWYLGVFALWLAARLFVWNRTILLEDHDSVSYLATAEAVLRDGVSALARSPDITFVYPLGAVIASLPGFSVETGARLATLVSGAVLFWVLAALGRHIAPDRAVLAGLALLAMSPVLIPLSISVLTEPAYIATVYLGVWLFWRQHRAPQLRYAALLGGVFALAFLNRLEGILLLGAVPLAQWGLWLLDGRARTVHPSAPSTAPAVSGGRVAAWSGIYLATFVLLVAPQVWNVSQHLGEFALNGRQVWVEALNQPGDLSYEEAIHGLTYDPGTRNLEYLRENPEARRELRASIEPVEMMKLAAWNFEDFYRNRLPRIIGPLGVLFFGVGLLHLLDRRRHREVLLILALVAIGLAAPLFHNVVIRHVAIVGPILLLTAGIGIDRTARAAGTRLPLGRRGSVAEEGDPTAGQVSGSGPRGPGDRRYAAAGAVTVLLVAGTVAADIMPLRSLMHPEEHNYDYDPALLQAPVEIARAEARDDDRSIRLMARKGYLSLYIEGAEWILTPYTDYDGLARFAHLNDVELFYANGNHLREHPFWEELEDGGGWAFEPLHRIESAYGHPLTLYRFVGSDAVASRHDGDEQRDHSDAQLP